MSLDKKDVKPDGYEKQLKDKYRLCIIANASEEPVSYPVRNIASGLKSTEEVKIIRYIVDLNDRKRVVS